MFFHKYEYSYRGDFGDRYHGTSYALKLWATIILVFVLSVSLLFNFGQHSALKAWDARELFHDSNYTKWNDYQKKVEDEKSSLSKDNAELLAKYEALQCSTRGLVVTTVKGITLCMNPETKALHKIDGEAN